MRICGKSWNWTKTKVKIWRNKAKFDERRHVREKISKTHMRKIREIIKNLKENVPKFKKKGYVWEKVNNTHIRKWENFGFETNQWPKSKETKQNLKEKNI